MGRIGSEHDASLRKDIARWQDGEEATSRSCTLSIQRVTEKDNRKHAYHIVECKLEGTSVSLQQRFCSLGPEDPEGRTAAFCFSLSTGSLPAFRAFLFEHPDFSSSRSGDVSYLTGANMQSCFTVFVNSRKNTFLDRCFTAAICRFQNGSLRSISFRSSNEQVGIERVTTFLHSSKCRSWVHRTFKRDSTFASKAGISRPEGTLPAKCKRCGESEHPAYHDQRSQQENSYNLDMRQLDNLQKTFCVLASEDYLCSACLMVEREVIFAIRLEEQSEDANNWENFWNEASSAYMEDSCDSCCICGCEDNEDLADLVPCVCESNQAVVHTSCAAACTPLASPKVSNSGSTSPFCFICGRGREIMQNGGLVKCKDYGMRARGLKRSMNPIQLAGVEVKKPRTDSPDGVMQVENMPDSGSSTKIVVIENIVQIDSKHMDCTKTGAFQHGWRSVDAPAVVPFKKRRIQIAEAPRSPSFQPKQISPKVTPLSSPRPVSSSLESTSLKPLPLLPKSPSSEPDFLPLDSPSLNATSLLPGFSSPASMPSSKSRTPVPMLCSPIAESPSSKPPPRKAISQLPRSSCPRGASPQSRSSSSKHTSPSPRSLSPKPTSPLLDPFLRSSDLSPSQLSRQLSVRTLEQTASSPLKFSEQGSRSQFSGLSRADALKVTKESDMFLMRSSLFSSNQNQPISSQEVEDGELVVSTEKNPDDFEAAGWDLNTDMEAWDKLSDKVAYARKKMGKGLRTAYVSITRNFDASMHIVKANECVKDSSSELVRKGTYIGKHDECGILRCKELDANSEVLVVDKAPAVQQSEGFGKLESRTDVPRIENSALWKVAEQACEKQGLRWYRSVEKLEDTAGNPLLWESKTAPGGYDSERKQEGLMESCVEKCSTSGRVRSSGWDKLPEGFESAEEALKAAQEIFSRRGRGSWASSGRCSMLSSQGSLSAHRFTARQYEFRDSSRQFGDRNVDQPSRGRESINHTRRLGSSGDDYNATWGRRGAAGVQGRGHLNGWADNQQSRSTGQWGRHRSSSSFSSEGATNAAAAAAARVESSGFVVAPDGTILRGCRPSQGLRSTFGNSRGAQGPHITDNWPMGRSANIGTNMGGRGVGGRGVRQCARSGFTGSLSDQGGLADRGIEDRYGGLSYCNRSVDLRRSESPHRAHPSDHSHMSSRTPGLRPESRILRSSLSPPSPEPFGRKFFPASARSQCSSPPFSKWSHDRGEAESFREGDFKQPVSRSYGSSGRTLPHVVHGSSLTDERDWQVLAGTRSSPGARGGWSSSVYSEKARDGSPELRRSRREEEGHTGSISKDTYHGRSSPREVDKVRVMRGNAYKRDRSRDDDKRDYDRLTSRSTDGHKRASSRDGDDGVAPKRHRLSF